MCGRGTRRGSDLLLEVAFAQYVHVCTLSACVFQVIVQSGRQPSVLQKLCQLPFQYFSHPHLIKVLFPSLISACYNNQQNKVILQQEMSCVLLATFIQVCSRFAYRKPTHPSSVDMDTLILHSLRVKDWLIHICSQLHTLPTYGLTMFVFFFVFFKLVSFTNHTTFMYLNHHASTAEVCLSVSPAACPLTCKAPSPPTHTPFHCFCTTSTFDSYLCKLWLCLCSCPFVFLLLSLPSLFQRSSLHCKDGWLPSSIWVDLPATGWASCKQADSFIFPLTSFPALAHYLDYLCED